MSISAYEKLNLTGKSIIVTGGASGMGAEASKLFAARGANVTVVDLDEAQGSAVVEEIKNAGGEAQLFVTDITKEENAEAMVAAAVEKYGSLDAAYNNAGITGAMGLIEDYDTAEWQRIIDINLNAVFYCVKYQARHMAANGGGSIVNVSSTAGLIAYPGMPGYVASKHAVVGLTKAVALDYARTGVRVNAILPGSVETPMAAAALEDPAIREKVEGAQPIGRLGKPWEIAELAAWLVSDASGFVIGSAFNADGGVIAG